MTNEDSPPTDTTQSEDSPPTDTTQSEDSPPTDTTQTEDASPADTTEAVGSPDADTTEANDTPTVGASRDRGRRAIDRVRDLRSRARTHPRDRWLALAGAVLVGLGLAWLHWTGLVVAGAVIGLVSRTFWRGVFTAFGFGILVLVVFAATLGAAVANVIAMAPVVYLTVAAALGLPVFGSLVRGLG